VFVFRFSQIDFLLLAVFFQDIFIDLGVSGVLYWLNGTISVRLPTLPTPPLPRAFILHQGSLFEASASSFP